MTVNWRSPDALPHRVTRSDRWAVWRKGRETELQKDDILGRLHNWNINSAILIARPNASRFQVPAEMEEFQQFLQTKVRRPLAASAIGWFLLTAFTLLYALGDHPRIDLAYAAITGALLAVSIAEYFYGLKTPGNIAERSRFFYALQTNKVSRTVFIYTCFGMGAIGLAQLLLQHAYGSIEAAVSRFGFVFEAIRAGQYWRVLSGPFLHSGVLHFFANATSMAFTVPLGCFAASSRRTLAAIAASLMVAPLAQMMAASPLYDSYVGVSPAIFAVYGMLIARSALDRRLLPHGFAVTLAGFSLAMLLGAGAFSAHPANVAHFAGFVVGMCVGLPGGKRRS